MFVKMGTFSVEGVVSKVGHPKSSATVAFVADTGATYTTLPASVMKKLRVKPIRKDRFRLAGGSIVERPLGEVALDLGGGHSVSGTPTIFSDEGVFLLGSVTLEELGLAVDPKSKKLVRAEGLLLASGSARIGC